MQNLRPWTLPVSFRRSIAADKSLTHPKNAEGEDTLNEVVDDDLLLLLPDNCVDSLNEAELLFVGPTVELLLVELLLLSENTYVVLKQKTLLPFQADYNGIILRS